MKYLLIILSLALVLGSCTNKSKSGKETVWIYTSLYKDTIADIKPKLEKDFPNLEFKFYQAGSEDIAAKVNAEIIAGKTQADILISSDRFWYEEMADKGFLHKYRPPNSVGVPEYLRSTDDFYSTLSLPVMVLCFNNEVLKPSDAPKSFKDLTDIQWQGKFTTGSPLSSGTNFTTVAMLQHNYGWDFFKALKKNKTISQGGNSAVIRRIQSKERPVGWVLLENVLRFKDKDDRLQVIFPKDGVVIQSNVLAITKGEGNRSEVEKVANWMFGKQGQEAMIRSYMYSPLDKFPPPAGAPPLSEIKANAFKWTPEFIQKVVKEREQIKEKFSEILFE